MDEDDDSNQDSDIEDKSESVIDFDDSGFNRLINKVFDETDEQFQQKVQSIMDSEDLTEKRPGMKQQNVCIQSTEPCFSETTKTLFN